MERTEQLEYCKACSKKKFDKSKGLICTLSNAKAAFEDECESFDGYIYKPSEQEKAEQKKIDKVLEEKLDQLAKNKLPLITCVPPSIDQLGKKILRADEEKLVLKYSGDGGFIVFGVVLLAIAFFSIFAEEDFAIFFTIVSGLIGLYLLNLYFTVPKKKWVFDRTTQMVTVPGKYYTQSHEMPFDEMRVEMRSSGNSNTGVTRMYPVVVVPTNKLEGWTRINHVSLENLGGSIELGETWSFLSWYMDQNRPLPSGEVFDHCREREFLARKEKGFPLPMYYSTVPTPEAKPEFQKERDKVWTDEQFLPDESNYWKTPKGVRKLKIPKGSVEYYPKNNPEKWGRVPFKDPDNFVIAPQVNWVRYVFDDGRIVYTMVISNKVLIPPKGAKYTTEYFRSEYIDTYDYYMKKLGIED